MKQEVDEGSRIKRLKWIQDIKKRGEKRTWGQKGYNTNDEEPAKDTNNNKHSSDNNKVSEDINEHNANKNQAMNWGEKKQDMDKKRNCGREKWMTRKRMVGKERGKLYKG